MAGLSVGSCGDAQRGFGRRWAGAGGFMDLTPMARDLSWQSSIYRWMERARAEGARFPLGEYNARIPQDFIEVVMHRAATDADLPIPWSGHFRPAIEDDVLALLLGTE
jgi:hypothetical protein